MSTFLLVVLALDALVFAIMVVGALTQTRQPDGIGHGIMILMLLVAGIPLGLALLFWWLGLPALALVLGLAPPAAAVGYRLLQWRGDRHYEATTEGADLFTDRQAREIAQAIAGGDEAALRALKVQGANFNAAGASDETLLTFTIFYWPERVALMLELGADPNFGAGAGTGPVYRAVANGKADALALLLKAGARPDVTDAEGTPVIFHTLKTTDTRGFTYLADAGANLTGRDAQGYTLLMATASYRTWREASMLLAKGIDPMVTGKFGDTLTSILTTQHMDAKDLADPDYLAFLTQLQARGITIARKT